MIGQIFVVVFLLYFGASFDGVKAQLNVCPVQGAYILKMLDLVQSRFNCLSSGLNRTIQPGYPLIQCYTFYDTGACCQRYEEQAVFNRFSELRFVGSDTCVALMSNLLCYICSPDQSSWYTNDKVRLLIS